jgi:8-oxo-dGTP pyrophosphatase MutT (NUDIX family)/DNA-binding transcriptional regulator YhcF (GntR family)
LIDNRAIPTKTGAAEVGRVTAQVEEKVRDLIKSGEHPPDKPLPSERVLANEIGAGRTTIRLVLAKLASEGLIRAEHGRGYFIQAPPQTPAHVPDVDMEPWTIHGERMIYDNRWVRLALVDVEPPGVARFEHHVVRLARVAVAAVVDDDDHVLMLWRYRFVPERFGWELPGGIVDGDEDPASAAAREVEEETGWRPSQLNHVASYQPMVGMVDSPHEIFVGRGATLVGEPHDAEESGVVQWVPLSEIRDLMKRDLLMGSGTLVALLHILANGVDAAT